MPTDADTTAPIRATDPDWWDDQVRALADLPTSDEADRTPRRREERPRA